MYADTYAFFTLPFEYYSMAPPSAQLPARAKIFPLRYFGIILELGKRRAARPFVSRRIGGARIRQAVTSDAEMTVSVEPMRARATVAVYGWFWRGKSRPYPFEFPTVYGMCDYQALLRPANTERGNLRAEGLHPPHYHTKLATNLHKTHNQHGKVRNATDA